MKINENSWHYKFWAFTFENYGKVPKRTNLCFYSQRIFWSAALYLIAGSMLLVAFSIVLWGIFYLGFWKHTGISFAILGGLVAITTVSIGAVMYKERRARREISHPGEKHEPNIFFQWLSAKKQKVCPLVEFEKK